MMKLEVGPSAVEFTADDQLAGRYIVDDEFKPHIHPLNTPAGHTLSLRSPHDHKHHKGLMYALRAKDVNFWEEISTLPDEVPGVQQHERFASFIESGETIGFEEDLIWRAHDGGKLTFRERRLVTCHQLPEQEGYEWSWFTELEVLRDVELIMSQWSVREDNGGLVNYHGLGIRFRRDFGCTGGNSLLLDGTETSFENGMGQSPRQVEFHGSLDGFAPVRQAAVRIRQEQNNALFVLAAPFAFVSLGPTNLAPLHLPKGGKIAERYVVTVFDLPSS
jgi:hypothetical protein